MRVFIVIILLLSFWGCLPSIGRILHDDKEHGRITFRRAFELSSNIATSRFSQKLGGKKLYKYARQFGFGQGTGIDLPRERRVGD